MSRILVVDDLAANRQVLLSLLGHLGHTVIEAANGAEALAAIKAAPPDLLITDVLMPVMDGYELVRHLRLEPETRDLPVIFYTAHYGEREARELALTSGVSWVLTKPIEPEEALTVIEGVLQNPATSPPAARGPLPPEFDRDHLRLLTDKLSGKVEDLQSANSRLRALVNIGLELASERDADRLLQHVSVVSRDLFAASYVTLGILDRATHQVRRLLVEGADGAPWLVPGDARPGGILGLVMSDRRVAGGVNPSADPIALGLPASHPPIHAYLAAPVASPTYSYGWLCLVRNEGGAFSPEDEQLILALAGLLGRIYENGYFYSMAKRRADELEQEVLARESAESAQSRAIEALRVAEERMRFALEAAEVGIWDMDYVAGSLRWTETLERQYGLAPGSFPGTFDAFTDLVHPDDRAVVSEEIGKAVATGADFTIEHRALRPDGTVRRLTGAGRVVIDADGKPLRGIGISIDVTDRHNLEEQYQQAQKMEAVGRLAGGVAHDFNNLLTAILGYCELLLDSVAEHDPRRHDIVGIRKAGNSAASLTRQLLAFSRKQIIEPRRIDLNQLLNEVRALLSRMIGEDVTIALTLASGLDAVLADHSQVEQVIMNLAVNARDAMPNGGTLAISTANRIVGEHSGPPLLAPGHYVVLAISDTGVGMSAEVQARLFEPFFTTKEIGKGTGLGLATVHGIVARMGGRVEVNSELGVGTTFEVILPRTEEGVAAPDVAPRSPRGRAGGETVLVVEDAEQIREIVTILLTRLGYQALSAANAEEALKLFDLHPSIDVLLTDVVMPGASGPELTIQLTEQRPDLKVIYMSGYTDSAIIQAEALERGAGFLHKPFSSEALGQKIREALDRG